MATMESDTSRQSTLILQQELSEESATSKQSTLILQQNQIDSWEDAQQDVSESDSFSGFPSLTSAEIEQTFCDKLHGVFFMVDCSETHTSIVFVVRTVFETFLKQLIYAFMGQTDTSKDKFRLTTHVQKKNVYLEIDKNNKQLKVSGPGQSIWRDTHFKRLSINLYRTMITDKTQDEMDPMSPLTSTPSGMHAGPVFPVPTSPMQLIPPVGEELPVSQQISMVTEMISNISTQISSLQTQVTNLATEVIKLTEKQGAAEYVSPNDNTLPPNDPPNDPSVVIISSSQLESNENRSSPSSIQTNDNPEPPTQKRTFPKPKAKPTDPQPAPQNPEANNRDKTDGNSRKTLIIGDSIISGINPKGLKSNVTRYPVSGANVDNILTELQVFDLSQFATVILYVAGNDASKQIRVQDFEDKYTQLIKYIKTKNPDCKITVCKSCPRGDVDVSPYNRVIEKVCLQNSVKCQDMYAAFHGKDGLPTKWYYGLKDSVHLSNSGIKRLLGTLQMEHDVVENYQLCVFSHRKQPHNQNQYVHVSQPMNQQESRGQYEQTQPSENRAAYVNRGHYKNRGAYENRGANENRGAYEHRGQYANRRQNDQNGNENRAQEQNYENRGAYEHRGQYANRRQNDQNGNENRAQEQNYENRREYGRNYPVNRGQEQNRNYENRERHHEQWTQNQHETEQNRNKYYNGWYGDKCMICGRNNHSTSDCYHKEQLKCFKCGMLGHISSDCWNLV
ncbi:MAG: GDSL-type esterase/lipase family protein [Sedimenticola sp.]